jgi:ribosomal protein S12 methylthiotransferase accessory factor
VLPFLPELAASVLATQVLVVLLGISTPALAGNIVELNGLTLASEKHPVLQKPDCPACKKKETRPQPTLEELESADDEEGDLDEARARLVSPRCGVVKDLREVPRDASEPAAPYVFRAELANHRFVEEPGDELVASGKGMTRVAAMRSALGEAVERYSSGCWEEVEAVRGRRPEIGDEALDPRRLVLYRPEQYEHVPYAPYSDDTEIAWVPARSLVTSREVLVPALAASLVHQVAVNQEYLFGPSSNGLAAGSTLAGALLAATQEVLERDAFVIAWFNQLACAEVNPEEHPDGQIRRLSRSYARRGVALHLYKLPTDHPVHVFMGLALDATAADGPAAVAGLGADLHPARAAAKAVLEVGQVRPALRMRLRDPQTRQRMEELVADPHLVGDLHDHDLLYASPAMVAAFSFLAGGPAEEFDWRTDSLGEPVPDLAGDQLVRVVRYLGDLGYDVLYVNLTSPDMRQLRLHTVRVVIPEFQPIDFGWGQTRLGGKRMFELPHRLGLSARPTTVASVNDLPHPLA